MTTVLLNTSNESSILHIEDLEILEDSFSFKIKSSYLPTPYQHLFYNVEGITFGTPGEDHIHFENNNFEFSSFTHRDDSDSVIFNFNIVKPKVEALPESALEDKPPFFKHFPTLTLLIHDPYSAFRVEAKDVKMYADKVVFTVDGEFTTTIQNAKRLFLKNENHQQVFDVDSVSSIVPGEPSWNRPTEYSVTLKGTPVNPEETQRAHEEDTPGLLLDNDLGYEHLMLPMEYEVAKPSTDTTKPKTESLAAAMAAFNKRNL